MRALEAVAAMARNIRGRLAPLLVLYVLDVFVLGIGALSFIIGWGVILATAPALVRGVRIGGEHLAKAMTPLVAYALLDLAVFGSVYLDNSLAKARAERIIAALDRYQKDHGRYPERLDGLVPQYLPSVPRAQLNLWGTFFYRCRDGRDPTFFYVELPPFGRPTYRFADRTWIYID